MPDLLELPSSELPLLVFDGDCSFCRAIVNRWQAAIGRQVHFAPYQQVGKRFPQIDTRDFQRAVHFIDSGDKVTRGTEAVFGAMSHCGRKRWLLWLYRHLPPIALAAEGLYRLVAANRGPLTFVRRIWYGRDLKLPTYHISSALFLRLLGVIYLIAFVSLWTQIDGLIGDHGILPVKNYLEGSAGYYSQQSPPESPVWKVPTLAWINPHDGFLHVLCAAGTVLSIMLLLGLLPLAALIFLWLDYLSLFHAGQVFLGFQWDILLLETGFVAIFLAPFVLRSRLIGDRHPPRLAIWLVWWLLFRLMLESGAVKLTWNAGQVAPDGLPMANTWSSLTALNFHYWTQPLPVWTSWYAAKLPEWFQKLSVIVVLVIELGTPWLIFGPRRLRTCRLGSDHAVDATHRRHGELQLFQPADDAARVDAARRSGLAGIPAASHPRDRLAGPGLAHALAKSFPLPVRRLCNPARHTASQRGRPAQCETWTYRHIGFARRSVLFSERIRAFPPHDRDPSRDSNRRWSRRDELEALRVPLEAGRSRAGAAVLRTHQPRLDWQMWFEALRLEQVYSATGTIEPRYMSPWFQSLLLQLLKGEPAVVGLSAKNPFPNAPPKFLRISLYQYRFTNSAEGAQTGDWWHRERVWVGPAWSIAPRLLSRGFRVAGSVSQSLPADVDSGKQSTSNDAEKEAGELGFEPTERRAGFAGELQDT